MRTRTPEMAEKEEDATHAHDFATIDKKFFFARTSLVRFRRGRAGPLPFHFRDSRAAGGPIEQPGAGKTGGSLGLSCALEANFELDLALAGLKLLQVTDSSSYGRALLEGAADAALQQHGNNPTINTGFRGTLGHQKTISPYSAYARAWLLIVFRCPVMPQMPHLCAIALTLLVNQEFALIFLVPQLLRRPGCARKGCGHLPRTPPAAPERTPSPPASAARTHPASRHLVAWLRGRLQLEREAHDVPRPV